MEIAQAWIDRIRSEALASILSLPSTDDCYYIPKDSGIYFVIDTEKLQVVYVGSSSDMQQRWRGHALKKLVSSRTAIKKYRLAWKFLDKASFSNREHEEAFYIVLLRPVFNQIARCKIGPQSRLSIESEVLSVGRLQQPSRQACFAKYAARREGGI
jgi:excinuclease UvrABC nuclease subunit